MAQSFSHKLGLLEYRCAVCSLLLVNSFPNEAHALATFNALTEAREFREQLSSDKRRVAFLFGAGTSQAVGIEGIAPLTQSIRDELPSDLIPHYDRFLSELGPSGTVEHVLNRVRLCRELLDGQLDESACGVTGHEAKRLDREICRAIYTRVSVDPPKGLDPYVSFAAWVRSIARTHPVEIFTTNYDVLIERGLEAAEAPHFDGFIGSYQPYFSAASVETEVGAGYDSICPPRGWVRVWKLHGSIGWRICHGPGGRLRIVRVPRITPDAADDLLIYPSRQKYADSRKQPYIALHDRLRRFLLSGEALLVTAGYAFGDQHINEIIFEGLRTNSRLAVTALMYGDLQHITREQLLTPTAGCLNLTMYAADCASVGGVLGSWTPPGNAPSAYGQWPFWSDATNRFTLGDFTAFAEYLRIFLGVREQARAGSAQWPPAPDAGAVAAATNGITGSAVAHHNPGLSDAHAAATEGATKGNGNPQANSIPSPEFRRAAAE